MNKNLSLENIEGEIWRNISNYEGLYQISNFGRVKSLGNDKLRKEKILKQTKNKKGYLRVIFCKKGIIKAFQVHRLVANTFIPNPNNFHCVNHKDENKENNCVENLEWCTYQYNLNYGTCQQRRVSNIDFKNRTVNTDYKARTINTDYKAIAEKQSKRVYQYSKDGELVAIWNSTRECGRNGFSYSAVSQCCRNCFNREGNNTYKNYIWSYEELNNC